MCRVPCRAVDDVNLIWDNAMKYNQPKTDCYVLAQGFKDRFKKAVKSMRLLVRTVQYGVMRRDAMHSASGDRWFVLERVAMVGGRQRRRLRIEERA